MAASLNFKVGAGWRGSPDFMPPYVKVGGTWRAATSVHIKVGGVWKKVYQYVP